MSEELNERITITGVDPDVKRRLAVTCAEKRRTMSEVLRPFITRAMLELNGNVPTPDGLAETIEALFEVIELYQRRHYQEAEAKLAEVHSGRL